MSREQILQGLLQRGFPAHVAQGIVGNIAVESGFNPGINEIAPLVPGSRGGFGLFQHTGPRRRALEAFASQTGRPLADIDTQLDFVMQELGTTEKAAADALRGARTTEEAARIFSEKFLRPGIPHLDRRIAAATGQEISGQAATPTLLGSEGNDNMAEQPQGLLGGTKLGEFLTPDRRDHLIAALEGMTLNPNQALIKAAGGRIQQRQQDRAQAQQANRTVEFLRSRGRDDLIELARMDPRAAIQAAMQQPKAPGTKVIDGRLVNEQTGEVIADFSAPDVAARQVTGAELIKQYGLQEGGNIQPGALYNVKPDGSISQIGGAGTTVNVGGEIDPFKKKVAEIDAKTFSEMANVGIEARRTLAETNVLNKLLENSPTGFAANAAVWAKNNLGVNVTGGPVQALEASISRLVPAQRPPGSDVMSDADLELYKRSLPQLINSPEGNRIIVKTMRGAAEYNMQIGEIANQVLSGRISREQGRDMMLALPDPMAEAMTYIDTLSDNSGATPAPAPTGVATHRYNPQTGQIEEIK